MSRDVPPERLYNYARARRVGQRGLRPPPRAQPRTHPRAARPVLRLLQRDVSLPAAEAYIFRSAGGAPWQKLALSEAEGGLPQPLNHMAYALIIDPAAPGHLYAGLSNGDVWHSTDYGDAWKRLPFNLKGIHRTLIRL